MSDFGEWTAQLPFCCTGVDMHAVCMHSEYRKRTKFGCARVKSGIYQIFSGRSKTVVKKAPCIATSNCLSTFGLISSNMDGVSA
eukprot:364556-Chlamydomonas_euryale.AAC.22